MTTARVILNPGDVTCVDNFFSASEVDLLTTDLKRTWWWPSPIIRNEGGVLVSSQSILRTSTTTDETWLSDGTRELFRSTEKCLGESFGVSLDHFEPWQAARYRAGELFEEHHDAGFFKGDAWGERAISILIYLSDSPRGGSTYFPALGKRFQPVAGRLLAWPNLLPDGSIDQAMRHIASPARRVKTIVSTWIRELPTTPATN